MSARIADMLAAAQGRWRSYACRHGRQTDIWVSAEDHATIEAGIACGLIETREIPSAMGTLSQWREARS